MNNVLKNILGKKTTKDRYSHNMAIAPEKFKTKFEAFRRKQGTGAQFMNIADELDDQQLASINDAYNQKVRADAVLKPYGLGGADMQDSWLHFRTQGVQLDRQSGTRKEKNPKKTV